MSYCYSQFVVVGRPCITFLSSVVPADTHNAKPLSQKVHFILLGSWKQMRYNMNRKRRGIARKLKDYIIEGSAMKNKDLSFWPSNYQLAEYLTKQMIGWLIIYMVKYHQTFLYRHTYY